MSRSAHTSGIPRWPIAFGAWLAIALCSSLGTVSAEPTAVRDVAESSPQSGDTHNGPKFAGDRGQRGFEVALIEDMQRTVHWQLNRETVEALAARVRRELKVPVAIEWSDLEDAGVGREDAITEQFEGLSLERAMETALRRLHLVWTLSGKSIVFTTPEGAEENLETRVYAVGDLLDRGEFKKVDFDSLTDVITATLAADSWAENGGGVAEIRPFDSGGIRVLIVSQTFATHRKIAQLLQDMRATRDAEGATLSPAISFDEFRELLIPLKSLDVAQNDAVDESDDEGRERLKFLATTDGLREVARRSNEFSLELMRRITIDARENSVICGYSVREAMTLIALGASGECRCELVKALQLPESTQKAAAQSLAMRFHLSSTDSSGAEFSSTNCLWLQQGLTANSEFVAIAKKGMNAEVQSVDFRQPTDASKSINEWTAKWTNDGLKEVISPSDIVPESMAAIVNATCFKGVWETPFSKEESKRSQFKLLGGGSSQVLMMHGKVFARAAAIESSGPQIAELPYRGERISAVIVLPKPGRDGLNDIESSLSAESLSSWLEPLEAVELQLTMPKFKIASRLELKPALAAMGLSKVFDLASADLRRIVDGPMAIERVMQSSLIEVDERGTEAAAATVGRAFGGITSTPLHTMVVDRPFLFLIRDVRSGCLLFIARVTNPAK